MPNRTITLDTTIVSGVVIGTSGCTSLIESNTANSGGMVDGSWLRNGTAAWNNAVDGAWIGD